MTDIPVDSRLRANADFLERKGWSKSAVLEREAVAEIERLRSALTASEQRATFLWEALQIVFNDDSGDLDFIKFKIRQFLPGEKL